MRGFLKFLVIAPLALLFVTFAVANRQNVTLAFDPFAGGDIPPAQITLPLFVVLIGAAMFGVVLGGVSTWLRQGRHRKAARAAKATAENLRAENGQLRGQIATLKTPAASTALAPLDAA